MHKQALFMLNLGHCIVNKTCNSTIIGMQFSNHLKQLTIIFTSGRRQSKTLLTIDENGSKIDRNSVFDCHLLPVRRQMAIKKSVSKAFLSTFLDSNSIFDCRIIRCDLGVYFSNHKPKFVLFCFVLPCLSQNQ